MILDSAPLSVQTGGLTAHKFALEASSKAFQILSSTLYKNPTLAVVRELSCNAYDSHVAAGTTSRAFDIHVPNALEPFFSIRDYGIGLSDRDVIEIYSTYFKSTKTGSNDYVGALGLGSKSPFSYTNTFTVNSFFGGKRHSYLAFIDKSGIPSIAHVDTIDSDEHPGMEIQFPVKASDTYLFRNAVGSFFRTWSGVLPNIVGAAKDDVMMVPFTPNPELCGDGWFATMERGHSTFVMQGNVPYPLSWDTILMGKASVTDAEKDHIKLIAAVLKNTPMIVTFPIGKLDFSASREELQYTDQTITTILDKMKEIVEIISESQRKRVVDAPTKWEAKVVGKELRDTQPAIQAWIMHNHGNEICKCGETLGSMLSLSQPTLTEADLRKLGRFAHFSRNYGKSLLKVPVLESIGIDPTRNTFFVVNDLPRGHISRLKHTLLSNARPRRHGNVFLLDKLPDGTLDVAEAQKILTDALGLPSTVFVQASSLAAPPAKPRGPSTTVRRAAWKLKTTDIGSRTIGNLPWERGFLTTDIQPGDFYVTMRRDVVMTVTSSGTERTFYEFPRVVDNLSTAAVIPTKPIYAVRPSDVKHVPAGAINLVEFIGNWCITTGIPALISSEEAQVKECVTACTPAYSLLLDALAELPSTAKLGPVCTTLYKFGTASTKSLDAAKLRHELFTGVLDHYVDVGKDAEPARSNLQKFTSAVIDTHQKVEKDLNKMGAYAPGVYAMCYGFNDFERYNARARKVARPQVVEQLKMIIQHTPF